MTGEADGAAAEACVTAQLQAWRAPSPAQDELRRHYLYRLEQPGALRRESGPEHLTASALVLDEAGTATLLVHHAKGGFWVQPGGHWEPGDSDLAATAVREATEETGVSLCEGPVLGDLNRHELPAAFGRCRVHDDVLYVVRTTGRPRPRVSAESLDVAWFSLDALPRTIVADLPARLSALGAARNALGPATS